MTNIGTAPARLAIDYVVHHAKADGTETGKTFKLTTATLGVGEQVTISRRHSFRAVTTRRYYPGRHAIELQVNGSRSAECISPTVVRRIWAYPSVRKTALLKP